MAREKTQVFGLHGAVPRRHISTQTFRRAEVQRNGPTDNRQRQGTEEEEEITRKTKVVRDCCRECIKGGRYRNTEIDSTVFAACGHYVTVKKRTKKEG